MQRFCLTLDLRPDPLLMQEYIQHHRSVWPEIQKSILDAGVVAMEIYLTGSRLFMIMETDDAFTLEHKAALDAGNPTVLEWERLMSKYQQVDEGVNPTRRWQVMDRVFRLTSPDSTNGS